MVDFIDYKPESSCQIAGLQSILAGVFGLLADGTFVEVGAFDGRTYSNTYHLAKLGWRGLYIEPVPDYYDRCIGNHKNHPNVSIVNKFVSSGRYKVQMYRSQQGTYSGDTNYIKLTGEIDWSKVVEVETDTLPDIMAEAGFEPCIDLLVIDVEGHEVEVLRGMEREGEFAIIPTLIIIEAHTHHENCRYRFNSDTIQQIMDMNGYVCIYSDGINDIYKRG